jgi:hypothetical protein
MLRCSRLRRLRLRVRLRLRAGLSLLCSLRISGGVSGCIGGLLRVSEARICLRLRGESGLLSGCEARAQLMLALLQRRALCRALRSPLLLQRAQLSLLRSDAA